MKCEDDEWWMVNDDDEWIIEWMNKLWMTNDDIDDRNDDCDDSFD